VVDLRGGGVVGVGGSQTEGRRKVGHGRQGEWGKLRGGE
jgi:hypothetical protein